MAERFCLAQTIYGLIQADVLLAEQFCLWYDADLQNDVIN